MAAVRCVLESCTAELDGARARRQAFPVLARKLPSEALLQILSLAYDEQADLLISRGLMAD